MNVEKRLVEELCTRHGCHTVILYGSRARGDFSAESDHDVLGVRADGPSCRDARPWEGSFLDAFIYPEAALQELDDGMARLAGGKVLVERDGFGTELIRRAEALYHAPARALPADEAAALRTWLGKMLARIARDDLEARYRRVWLLYQILEDHFALRGLRYHGPKQALRWLAEHDPVTAARFEAALTPGAPLSDIEALVGRVLGT